MLLIFSLLVNFVLGFKLFSPESISKKGRTVVATRVIDGDTFIVNGGECIRLAGIDAPEYSEACLSTEAKEKLEELILGKKVELKVIGPGKFNRTIAFVFVDDILVSRLLLSEGLGVVIETESEYLPQLLQAELEAQKLKKGIYSSLCLSPKNCQIKGNYRRDRGTKIYHLPDCYNYEKIVINESKGDYWFCSETEARAAGFVKSLDCLE